MMFKRLREVFVVHCDVCGRECFNYITVDADTPDEQHACSDWNEKLQVKCADRLMEKLVEQRRAGNASAKASPDQSLAVRLHRALERAQKYATYFRFSGDGQFGLWQEARRDHPGAVAFYTTEDVQKIVHDAAGVPGTTNDQPKEPK